MAEVQSRGGGSRGRGGFRGGRGGFRGTRNPSRSQHKSEEQENLPPAAEEDQGDIGELLKQYGDNVPTLKAIYPDWSNEDLVYALNETDGDVAVAADRISTGSISQWGKVEKKHAKPKESALASTEASTRGRGRGGFEGRGRGRGAERGAARGGRGAKSVSTSHTNGTKATGDGWDTTPAAQTTADAGAGWDTAPTNGDAAATGTDDWANEPGKDALNSLQTEEPKPASAAVPAAAKARGWAGLFAKPTPPPAPKKAPAPTSAPAQTEQAPVEAEPSSEPSAPTEPTAAPPIEPVEFEDGPSELPSAPHSDGGKELTPSKDALTEHNLEKLPDSSHPVDSATAASTVASTLDPSAGVDHQKAALRPPISGYHATALKATSGTGRSASYARKLAEQQEAVVMPGNHGVEKAAVQFGKMGLTADDVDVDEDREEPETRTQLPDDSPAAPRASLPPALPGTQQTPTQDSQTLAEAPVTAQRQSAGLPPAPQQQPHEPSPQSATAYADQYRHYGQTAQKFDPFGPQHPSTHAQSQEPFSNQVPNQASTATTQPDYSAAYQARQAFDREAYNAYYGAQYGYGQEAQRSGSAFGASAPETQSHYATARPQQGLGQQDSVGSGHNTPAPGLQAQHGQQQSTQHAQQSQAQQYPAGYGYPQAYNQQYAAQYAQYAQHGQNPMNPNHPNHRYGANRPAFDDVRRQQENDYNNYGNQYNYGQYANAYKPSMYGQPQQSYSYEQHTASPANAYAGAGREATYGRTGSTQPLEGQQTSAGSTGFGGMPDPFGRSTSGFGQAPGLGQQHTGHAEDPAKASGPSPSMQGGRPGSAVNSGFPGQQGGLPPPSQHSAQQFAGYGGYGANIGGGHQNAQQNSGYAGGNYGSNAAFGGYGQGYGGVRGGWNTNNGSYGANH